MAQLESTACVAVLGAGTMGAGIAQVAATAGHKVFLFDINPDAVSAGIEGVKKGLEKLVSRKKMSADVAEGIVACIKPSSDIQELASASLVIEAIVEKLEVKQAVFKQLEALCGSHCIFASNTSSISITAIGAGLKDPSRLVGMHFFNPAPILKLVEVISGVATAPEVAQTVYDTATAWGKAPVHAKSTPGFIVNRVARPFYAEGLRVLEEGGADVATIDTIMRECGGFKMGPFELMDLIGHDVNYAVTTSVFNAYYCDGRFKPALSQLELVNAGFFGRKSGRGFYDYSQDKPKAQTLARGSEAQALTANVSDSNLAALISMAEAAGIRCTTDASLPNNSLCIANVTLALSDGRSATQRHDGTDFVLLDWSLDYTKAERLVITKSDQTDTAAIVVAAGFLQQLGKQVSLLDDVPGMLVGRTLSMLINESFDAVNQGVASPKDIDIAMCKGVNYPRGPMAWCDAIGVTHVANLLENLQRYYGEERYRLSPLLRRFAMTNRSCLSA